MQTVPSVPTSLSPWISSAGSVLSLPLLPLTDFPLQVYPLGTSSAHTSCVS
jgi:hypothetical protein